ncbi:hypothetical protein GCM10010193_28750 [Kitasatospora atroaurantiaca]|uniref:Uncharacterized protein n=1 Tax=Kitasatospora atroaurantiaca TaxID=285545 RepID=A0A561EIX7_9ACTN|nr:hypothetical protein FB465_0472 [Kitasatospora atroaurantiaca]
MRPLTPNPDRKAARFAHGGANQTKDMIPDRMPYTGRKALGNVFGPAMAFSTPRE